MALKPPLIIPVENQVRELDPKLLLACIAARRGFTSIIGSHREIDFRIASFPRGLYLNKSMTARNLKMFQIMRRLGHAILTWDEEALVHLPPDIYYSRRLSPVAIRYVSQLFAWGDDNADLWRRYPHLPDDLPIHVTGNPRNDMLRPELHGFYAEQIRTLRETYGDFVLINTNFNHVNAFFPAQNLFKPARRPDAPLEFGKAGVGMTRAYAEGLRAHKQAIFEAFQRLLPELTRVFPHLNIVVRPHPTEGQEIYRHLADGQPRIHVTNEGNVVPWLLAARALIHNGCTTGVEAYIMRVPAISYRAVLNEDYDSGFYLLPNRVSHQAFDLEQLFTMLRDVLSGRMGPAEGEGREAFVKAYIAAIDGPLACERMMDVLEKIGARRTEMPIPSMVERLAGRTLSTGRRVLKHVKSYLPGSHAPPEFHRHRYPAVSTEDIRRRTARFLHILGTPEPLTITPIGPTVFQISA
jgi:surface carbohydrate biosynthesis protein